MFNKERLAKSLRECNKTPDYFIFIDSKDYTYDLDILFGIKVLHVSSSVSYTPHGDSDLEFIPCWNNESDTKNSDSFERAWERN